VATLRKRSNGHWQARVRKANQTLTKTFPVELEISS